MELDWLKYIPVGVSAIAACLSAYFAIRAQRLQASIIQNKSIIEELSSLIEKLIIASAIESHPHDFTDEDFESGSDLSDVPSRIAIIISHGNIASQLDKADWNFPISNLCEKIDKLKKIRKTLL